MLASDVILRLEHLIKKGDNEVEVYLQQHDLAYPIDKIVEETHRPPPMQGKVQPLARTIYIDIKA